MSSPINVNVGSNFPIALVHPSVLSGWEKKYLPMESCLVYVSIAQAIKYISVFIPLCFLNFVQYVQLKVLYDLYSRLCVCLSYRSWGCCTLHHKIWRGYQLPSLHKLQGHVHRCRDDARERPVGVMFGKTYQQLSPALHSEGRHSLWGEVHLQQAFRKLTHRQNFPLQARQRPSVL